VISKVFDYLDGCDIEEAFSKLNIRFQCLFTYSSLLAKIIKLPISTENIFIGFVK
jgi:hypothetical protein